MNPVFEKLSAVYLREVMEIENCSFPQPWTQTLFEREINLPLSRFYVVLVAGKVTAYGGYWHVLDEGHIVSLAVHPGYRRSGLGRTLLRFLVDDMIQVKITKALLEVRRSNCVARQLYCSCGFTENGFRPNYYNTEDAILMERLLP